MVCGKIVAGKSTLASRLGHVTGTVVVCEDDWLDVLLSDEMSSASDYLRFTARLRRIMGPHFSSLLNAGVSVVPDFPANTVEQRAWMRGIVKAADASHQLYVLCASDELCWPDCAGATRLASIRLRSPRSSSASSPGILRHRRRKRASMS
jgi:predicted kinase